MKNIIKKEIQKILKASHNAPQTILGPHYSDIEKSLTIRVIMPRADRVYVIPEERPDERYEMEKIHRDGLFELVLNEEGSIFKYRFHIVEKNGNTYDMGDPYALTADIFSDFDNHLFAQGNHYQVFEKLGAHPLEKEGVRGVNFAVWAPNAGRVSVVGPFNRWDGRCHQMRLLGESGVWEIFIPDIGDGEIYKYEIMARKGDIFLKCDPYAFYAEVPPETASIVYDLEGKHKWNDRKWMNKRTDTNIWEMPVSIYEVHLGSWMKGTDDRYLSYRELASKLIPYVKDLGFTHIELMPIAEHPYAPSWGYQVSGFYAPTSRFGEPVDFMEFVDLCHQNDIGVILDWVPAHFPKDAHTLAWFDGTSLYEHEDPRKGEHREWGTLIFNYGRHEIENFLIANALFWLDRYHLDGLRVDAVASMLYLDYSREAGDWIPNKYGGNENLEAIEFLKHINTIVHEKNPGVMMIAEESTAWPAVSRPVDDGGLGFGFKWNMGWMHDVLLYMGKEAVHRKYHHNNLTFGLIYAFNENFILPLSHDEVVHGKRSLLSKMQGDEWQQFANLRLLYSFMYAHPGKKLLFMGGEIGQCGEWDHSKALDWELLDKESHRSLQHFVSDLNRLYRSEKAFYENDFRDTGFEWIEMNNADENLLAFVRKAKDPRECLFFAMNFSPVPRESYRMGVPFPVFYRELLNSDAKEYWGSGRVLKDKGVMAEDLPCHGRPYSLLLQLPPLGAVVLKPVTPEESKAVESLQTAGEAVKKRGRRRKSRKKTGKSKDRGSS